MDCWRGKLGLCDTVGWSVQAGWAYSLKLLYLLFTLQHQCSFYHIDEMHNISIFPISLFFFHALAWEHLRHHQREPWCHAKVGSRNTVPWRISFIHCYISCLNYPACYYFPFYKNMYLVIISLLVFAELTGLLSAMVAHPKSMVPAITSESPFLMNLRVGMDDLICTTYSADFTGLMFGKLSSLYFIKKRLFFFLYSNYRLFVRQSFFFFFFRFCDRVFQR